MIIPNKIKVTMFKSSDEQLHPTAAAWALHEARLAVRPSVTDLLLKAGFSADITVSAAEVVAFVSSHADELLQILSPLLPKKTRAARGTIQAAIAGKASAILPANRGADAADAAQGQLAVIN